MSSLVGASSMSFETLYTRLKTLPAPLRPPSKPSEPELSDAIASLYVHPTLEAGLHLLNNDLYSAHFLCRHMQASPAFEGMYLHGILHRIEGDYDNARAWYRDVKSSDVFKAVWSDDVEAGQVLIDQTESLVKSRSKSESAGTDEGLLAQRSVDEIIAVVEFCKRKFGTERIADASSSWKNADGELKELGQDMVSGGKGRRDF